MPHAEPKRTPEIPPPLDIDGVRTVEVLTGVWFLAFLALLPFYGRLQDDGHAWWLWTSLAGAGLGLIGIELCRRLRDRRLAREQQR